jgi:hypothetical protein
VDEAAGPAATEDEAGRTPGQEPREALDVRPRIHADVVMALEMPRRQPPIGAGGRPRVAVQQHQLGTGGDRPVVVTPQELPLDPAGRGVAVRRPDEEDAVGPPQAQARPGGRGRVGFVDHEPVRDLPLVEPGDGASIGGIGLERHRRARAEMGVQSSAAQVQRRAVRGEGHRQPGREIGQRDACVGGEQAQRDRRRIGRPPRGCPAQPRRELAGELEEYLGVPWRDPVERRFRQLDQLGITGRVHGRRPRFVGEQPHLADALATSQLSHRPRVAAFVLHHRPQAAAGEDVHAVGRVSLAAQHLAAAQADPLGLRREVVHGQPGRLAPR